MTIDLTKNKRPVTPHDHTKRSYKASDMSERSYQTPDTPDRSQEGHRSGHDLDTRSHLEDKSPVLKEQPIERQTITSQAPHKP